MGSYCTSWARQGQKSYLRRWARRCEIWQLLVIVTHAPPYMGQAAEGLSRSYLQRVHVTCGTYFVLGLETAHILYPLLDSLLSKGRHCEITSYSVARTNKRPSHTTPSNSNDYKFGNLCRCLCACTGNWNVLFCGQFASKGSCFRYCNVAVLQGTFKDGKCYILMWSTFLNISVFSRGL